MPSELSSIGKSSHYYYLDTFELRFVHQGLFIRKACPSNQHKYKVKRRILILVNSFGNFMRIMVISAKHLLVQR